MSIHRKFLILVISICGNQLLEPVEASSRVWAETEVPELPPAITVKPDFLGPEEIKWRQDLRAALEESRESKKPVFLFLGTIPCGARKIDLQEVVLTDKRVVEELNSNFICVQNRYELNRDVDNWAHRRYSLGYGGQNMLVIQPDLKAHNSINDVQPEMFLDSLWRTTIDWSKANQFAKEGSLKEVKKELERITNNKLCKSQYLIYERKDDKRDNYYCRILWAKGGIATLNLTNQKIAFMRMVNEEGKIIRRGYRPITVMPIKSGKRVEVRTMRFTPLSAKEACTVSGTVLAADGKPAKKMQFCVDTQSFEYTDDEGRFTVNNLSSGKHHLYFQYHTPDTNESLTEDISLVEGERKNLDLKLKLIWQKDKVQSKD